MVPPDPSLADEVIRRLTGRYGPPGIEGRGLRWVVRCGAQERCELIATPAPDRSAATVMIRMTQVEAGEAEPGAEVASFRALLSDREQMEWGLAIIDALLRE